MPSGTNVLSVDDMGHQARQHHGVVPASVMTDLSAHRHQRLGEHGRPVIAMTVGWAAPAAEQNRLGHPSGGCVTLSKTFDTDASSRRLTVWLPYAE